MSSNASDKSQPSLDRGASAGLWRHTLSQVPSLFGRLVYLSSLRNSNSGSYDHHGLAAVFGYEEANRAIRQSHEDCFSEWLESELPRQKAELEIYVAGLDPEKRTVVEVWSKLEPYRNLPPESARALERDLFLADLETLLRLLRNELGVASPDPDA
ncbi:MAG TPA: hypothetical protein VM120_04490 [Bryobacteraceae bacterium]|nr:hypothetical protein [Bryobacteraceae bacterium]